MLPWGMAIYAYVIMYGDNAGETVHYVVHMHLKDILGHFQAKKACAGTGTHHGGC